MYKFVIWLLTPFIKFFLRVKLEGRVNVPEGEKFIICANHISNWDPILVVVCTGIPINFLAKESLFKIPFVRGLVKAFGTIPVNRKAADTASIRKSIEVIQNGGCFSIFPQGMRTHVKPQPDQAKKGVGLICHKAEAGVLPIGITTKNYKVAPATTYTETPKSDELEVVWNQVTQCIVTGSWNCIYSKSDGQFNMLLKQMINDAKAYGYEQCIEWCEENAKLRHQLEEATRQ